MIKGKLLKPDSTIGIICPASCSPKEDIDMFIKQFKNFGFNIVMKVLASVTILMAIPTIIGGIFGMNVWLPFAPDDPMAFYIIMILTFLICGIVAWVLYKKDMFR